MVCGTFRVMIFLIAVVPTLAEAEETVPARSVQEAEHNEIKKLLGTLPRLDPKDRSLQSFEFTGQLPSPVSPTKPIHARVGWSRDTSTAVLLSTVEGKTPLLWAAQDKALICDFTSTQMTVVENVHPTVLFRIAEGEIKYRYRLYSYEAPHIIDLPSFAAAFSPSWTLTRDESVATLSATSQSGRSVMTMRFRLDPEPQFVSFVIHANDKQKTALNSIDTVRINEPLSPALLAFPNEPLARHQVPVQKMKLRNLTDAQTIGKRIGQTLIAIPLLKDPLLRKQLAEELPIKDVDWGATRTRFDELAPQLRLIANEILDTAGKSNED